MADESAKDRLKIKLSYFLTFIHSIIFLYCTFNYSSLNKIFPTVLRSYIYIAYTYHMLGLVYFIFALINKPLYCKMIFGTDCYSGTFIMLIGCFAFLIINSETPRIWNNFLLIHFCIMISTIMVIASLLHTLHIENRIDDIDVDSTISDNNSVEAIAIFVPKVVVCDTVDMSSDMENFYELNENHIVDVIDENQ